MIGPANTCVARLNRERLGICRAIVFLKLVVERADNRAVAQCSRQRGPYRDLLTAAFSRIEQQARRHIVSGSRTRLTFLGEQVRRGGITAILMVDYGSQLANSTTA